VTQRYYPWGTVRSGSGNALPTGYTFTGQLDTGVGLMYYGARLYDAALARFIQPDTIVPEPGNPQSHPRMLAHHECTNYSAWHSCIRGPIRGRPPQPHRAAAGQLVRLAAQHRRSSSLTHLPSCRSFAAGV